MKLFLAIYIIIAAAVVLCVFFLSKNEGKSSYIKTALTVVCILALLGVLIAMAVLEGKYQMQRLYSTLIAAAIVGCIYIADRLGAKFNTYK